MSMNSFPFVYKNWYYWLVFCTNIFVPVVLFSYWQFSSFSEMKYVAPSMIFLFLILLIIYSMKTLSEYKVCVLAFSHSHKYISKFLMGILCSFISMNMGFIICATGIYKSENNMFKGFLLACSIISGLLGLVSNVFMNLFEFKINFEFFYSKYKDNVFKDIVDSMVESKKQIQESYGKHSKIHHSSN